MRTDQGPNPGHAAGGPAAATAADMIQYGPLWMKFTEPEWESAFRDHFAALLINADIIWCVFTYVLTIHFYVKLGVMDHTLYAEHLPDMLMFGAITAVVCFLTLRRPSAYVRVRTYLLFASRAYHQLVTLTRLGTELAPPDGATFAASRLPLDTAAGTIGRLLATCVYVAVVANGYQLAGRWHVANVTLNLVSSLVKNFRLCTLEVSPSYDTRRRDIHAVFVRWTDRALAWALPLAVAGSPAEEVGPCAVFRLWALVVWGCLGPLLVANLLEEWCRLSFLKAKGGGVLAPTLPWRAAHAAAILFLGSRLVWEVLILVSPLLDA